MKNVLTTYADKLFPDGRAMIDTVQRLVTPKQFDKLAAHLHKETGIQQTAKMDAAP